MSKEQLIIFEILAALEDDWIASQKVRAVIMRHLDNSWK